MWRVENEKRLTLTIRFHASDSVGKLVLIRGIYGIYIEIISRFCPVTTRNLCYPIDIIASISPSINRLRYVTIIHFVDSGISIHFIVKR